MIAFLDICFVPVSVQGPPLSSPLCKPFFGASL